MSKMKRMMKYYRCNRRSIRKLNTKSNKGIKRYTKFMRSLNRKDLNVIYKLLTKGEYK